MISPRITALVSLAAWDAQGYLPADTPDTPEQIRAWAAKDTGDLWRLFRAGHAAGVVLGTSMPDREGECWATATLEDLIKREHNAALQTFTRLQHIEAVIFWCVVFLFVAMPAGSMWLRHLDHPHLGDALVVGCAFVAATAGWILRRTWDLMRRIRGADWLADRRSMTGAPLDVLEAWVFAPQRAAARRWDETIRQCGWALQRWYEQRSAVIAESAWVDLVERSRAVRSALNAEAAGEIAGVGP